jgi:hypothetical protein
MGPAPSIGPCPSRSTGVSIRNRVPILGRCFRFFLFPEFCGAQPPCPFARLDSLSSIGGRRRERLRLRRSGPRASPPLLRPRRLWGCFHNIGIRSGGRGLTLIGMICLDVLVAISHGRFRWRGYRRLGLWFATQTKLLCQGGSMLRIGRGRQGMIGPQTPAPQIFVPAQSVSGGYVAA